MPRIRLKPNSAEYADTGASRMRTHVCNMDGCMQQGEYKAPKHRGLNEYYHFCLDHVREYNRAWNYFSGMSDEEMQDHVMSSLYGFRPTWKYGVNGDAADALRDKIWQTYHFTDEEPPRNGAHGNGSGNGHEHGKNGRNGYHHTSGFEANSAEFQALAIMGLEPPITLAGIKEKYKELAKKHHPDLNKGCTKSEELLKQINMAYTILKAAYEKFEKLPDQKPHTHKTG
ncbi:MAG: J domain-containing protein [Alphaproteobacteria bacterium]